MLFICREMKRKSYTRTQCQDLILKLAEIFLNSTALVKNFSKLPKN